MQRGLLSLVCWLALVGLAWGQAGERCKHRYENRSGTARADITVSTAAVTVIAANTALCKASITNTSTTNALRCGPVGTDPTATTGVKILPYQVWSLDQDAQLGVRCIRDTSAGADIAVTTMEYEP